MCQAVTGTVWKMGGIQKNFPCSYLYAQMDAHRTTWRVATSVVRKVRHVLSMPRGLLHPCTLFFRQVEDDDDMGKKYGNEQITGVRSPGNG